MIKPPDFKALTLIGGVDVLLPITNKDIFAYIDFNKVKNIRQECPAYIDKPDGIRIDKIEPKLFKVTIIKKL